jgi:hypothetical protein
MSSGRTGSGPDAGIYVGSGSFATVSESPTSPAMSAMPRQRTKFASQRTDDQKATFEQATTRSARRRV